jgi:hypothetical protein
MHKPSISMGNNETFLYEAEAKINEIYNPIQYDTVEDFDSSRSPLALEFRKFSRDPQDDGNDGRDILDGIQG